MTLEMVRLRLPFWPRPAAAATTPAADDLHARVGRAEPAAVAAVYDQHHERVRGFAPHLVGDTAAAEDLVQEAFPELPRALRKFRGDAALGTFLCAIAVNHARHHARSATRRRRAMEALEREAPGGSSDPEHDAARRQLGDALRRGLDALPLDQRVAFVLCDVEER